MIPRALDLYSSNADLLSDRASWYVKQDEFQLAKRDLVHSVALNDFEATLSLNAELSDVYLDRGILHFMPGA